MLQTTAVAATGCSASGRILFLNGVVGNRSRHTATAHGQRSLLQTLGGNDILRGTTRGQFNRCGRNFILEIGKGLCRGYGLYNRIVGYQVH